MKNFLVFVLIEVFILQRSWIEKEFPQHEVTLDDFLISKYPVTNKLYHQYCLDTQSSLPESIKVSLPDNHPVWGVSHDGAKQFCGWLSKKAEVSISLPTEAQWEYVAKGSSACEYPYGNRFSKEKANTIESGIGTTTAVDAYEQFSSALGVCDLAGNVEEWVRDTYKPYPGGAVIQDHLFCACGVSYPILRGGSFARGGDLSRSARRHGSLPKPEFRFTGFRVVVNRR